MWVSVVIPCYNVEAYVVEALDSVLAQDYPWLEVIAVDNNSTDGTLAILQTYEARFPDKIRVLQEKKQGAPAARNTGWLAAKGEWIQFLDADDLFLPGKIRRQMGMVENDASFIVGSFEYLYLSGNREMKKPLLNVWVELGHSLGITSSNLFNNQYLKDINGWRESVPVQQDFDLMLRLLKVNDKVIYDLRPSCIVRERKYSLSTENEHHSIRYQMAYRILTIRYVQRNKPEVWRVYAPEFLTRLLFYLRMLASTDLPKANKFYCLFFPPDFNFDSKLAHEIPQSYQLIFNILGFYYAEWLRLSLKKIIPGGIWAYWRRVLKKAPRPRKG